MNNLQMSTHLPRFKAYKAQHPTWGSLHSVLENGNTSYEDVQDCKGWAAQRNDFEGMALADILMKMNKSQRKRLPYLVDEVD